jgi:hypothetical protein
MLDSLGLPNMKLQSRDIRELDSDLGQFDYIIAHGVYSWVPPAVQDRILGICQENLNPNGVAYISYSVYPGAHVRAMIAGMLQYHARRFSTTAEQIEQTRTMVAFLAAAHPLVRQEAERLAGRTAQSLFHDDLAECHSPVYFHEFVERAAGHGLQYLAEADFFEMLDSSEPPEVSGMLRQLARDPIDKEQYMDFLKCRRFRQTLLCHAGLPLNRHIESAQMRQFHVTTGRLRDQQPEKIPGDHPVAKAALSALIEAWPAALSFDELLRRVSPGDDLLLCDMVLGFFACGLFQLHVEPPRFAASVSERPRASALARLQARTVPYVTNLCHAAVHLDDAPSIRLLMALDGTRDRSALLEELRPVAGPDLEQQLERSLQGMAKLALLEA